VLGTNISLDVFLGSFSYLKFMLHALFIPATEDALNQELPITLQLEANSF